MRIFVTGGTGFLGRHLVWRLTDLGHDVSFSGRDAAKAREVAQHATRPAQFTQLSHGQAQALPALTRAFAGADAVIHCAALSSPWGRAQDFHDANVRATAEVLAAMQRQHVRRLVHISTPSLYFEFRNRLGVREDQPLPPPINRYAATKREAEALVHAAPVHAVILRPRGIFGAWDDTLLPRLLRLLRRPRFPLFNGGDALIDLTYVDNVVDAVLLALTHQGPHGAIFNISNGEPRRAADLFEQLAHGFGLPWRPRKLPVTLGLALARGCELAGHLAPRWEPPLTRYTVGTVAYSQTLDLERAQQELGYTPRVGLDEGIRRTTVWLRSRTEVQPC